MDHVPLAIIYFSLPWSLCLLLALCLGKWWCDWSIPKPENPKVILNSPQPSHPSAAQHLLSKNRSGIQPFFFPPTQLPSVPEGHQHPLWYWCSHFPLAQAPLPVSFPHWPLLSQAFSSVSLSAYPKHQVFLFSAVMSLSADILRLCFKCPSHHLQENSYSSVRTSAKYCLPVKFLLNPDACYWPQENVHSFSQQWLQLQPLFHLGTTNQENLLISFTQTVLYSILSPLPLLLT